MDEFFAVANRVYSCLGDEESKAIYREGLAYNLTKDERCLDGTLSKLFLEQCHEEFATFVGEYSASGQLYIFGIGTWGRRIYGILNNEHIDINGWIDNSDGVSAMIGHPVYKPNNISTSSDAGVILAVEKHTDEIIKQLVNCGFKQENIWDMGKVIREQAKVLEERQYFDLEVLKPDDREVFVDCGAFDGMSSERFVKWSQSGYDKIYMFEANTDLYEKCKSVASKHDNCILINKGVWDEEKELEFYESPFDQEFNVDPGDHNCLDDSLKREGWIVHRIPVIRIDDVIEGRASFIKMDIEGSEAAAIRGAQKLIKAYKPKCAISIYHRPDDLWTIPELLLEYNPDYTFYLRHYSLGWGETILYAI